MSAIILAAGRGSRMGDLTKEKPKCFVKLGGKTLLEWQMDALQKAGVTTISIVCGYQKDLFFAHKALFIENEEWRSTNMVSSLLCAKERFSHSDQIISYSDILYHPMIIEKLLQSKGDIVITYDTEWEKLWRLRFEDPLSDAETFSCDHEYLTSIGDKPKSSNEIEGQFMGLLKISKNGWKKMSTVLGALSSETVAKMDMTHLLARLLNNNISVLTIPILGSWCEMDSEKDFQLYSRQIARSESWLHDWRENSPCKF